MLVESNILIDFLNGVAKAKTALETVAEEGAVYVSALSAAQVMAAARKDKRELTGILLDSFSIAPVEKEVALLGGRFWSDGGRNKLDLGDCIVAATACRLEAVLITKGRRRYPAGKFEVKTVSY